MQVLGDSVGAARLNDRCEISFVVAGPGFKFRTLKSEITGTDARIEFDGIGSLHMVLSGELITSEFEAADLTPLRAHLLFRRLCNAEVECPMRCYKESNTAAVRAFGGGRRVMRHSLHVVFLIAAARINQEAVGEKIVARVIGTFASLGVRRVIGEEEKDVAERNIRAVERKSVGAETEERQRSGERDPLIVTAGGNAEGVAGFSVEVRISKPPS